MHNAELVNNSHNNLFPNLRYYTIFFTLKVNKGNCIPSGIRGDRPAQQPLAALGAGELEQSLEEVALMDLWAKSAIALLAIQGKNERLPDV